MAAAPVHRLRTGNKVRASVRQSGAVGVRLLPGDIGCCWGVGELGCVAILPIHGAEATGELERGLAAPARDVDGNVTMVTQGVVNDVIQLLRAAREWGMGFPPSPCMVPPVAVQPCSDHQPLGRSAELLHTWMRRL